MSDRKLMSRWIVRAWLVVGLGALAGVSWAGDLNPPAGAVAPTMKPIDALDPRRVLNDVPGSADAVHVISQPGQYVLVRDVIGQRQKHGILVTADGPVTIHLNGFSLRGVPGSLDAVNAARSAACPSCSLSIEGAEPARPGSSRIEGWDGDGIDASNIDQLSCAQLTIGPCAGHAVHALQVRNIIHRDIAARNCLRTTFAVLLGPASSGGTNSCDFENVSSDASGEDGALIQCPAEQSTVRIARSSFTASLGHGVRLVHEESPPDGTFRAPAHFSITDTAFSGNGASGMTVDIPHGSPVCGETDHFRCIGNGGDGLDIRKGPGQPVYGEIGLRNSSMCSNGGAGLRSNNPLYVDKGLAGSNVLHGIDVSVADPYALALHLSSSVVSRNAGGGARCSRGRYANVDCQISDNGGNGITMGQGCLVMTNTSVTRSVGHGVATGMATVTATASYLRRNGLAGLSMQGGTCVAEGLVCEFNGQGGAAFNGCTSVSLSRCVFSENTGDGVVATSSTGPIRWMAPESLSHRNTGHGFNIDQCPGGQLSNCQAVGNGLFGIRCAQGFRNGRIENCHTADNGGGIQVEGDGNLVIGNSATAGPLGAFVVSPASFAGQIFDGGGINATCNPKVNVVH